MAILTSRWFYGTVSGFLDRPDLASLVMAAVRADLMRRLGFPALRAGAHRNGRQGIMGAALRRPGLGMAAFWIGHVSVLLLSVQ